MEANRRRGPPWGVLASLVLAAPFGCGDRARPTGLPDDPGAVMLSVQLLAPEQGQVRQAGTAITVTVRATEPFARLTGLGYEARLNNFERDLLDSAQVAFAGVSDTTVTFEHQVPADFTNNVQIDFFGVALGPSEARMVSVPRSMLIIR